MKQTELIIFVVIMVINAVFAIWKKYKERQARNAAAARARVAVERGPGVLRITVVQSSDPRAGSLTLVFSERPFRLAGWIVSDAQGATTRVTLSDIETGATMDPGLFLFREEFPQGN